MAVIVFQEKFAAQNTSITATALNSVTNGSAATLAATDNTANLDLDHLVNIVWTGGASGVSATGTCSLYFAASYDGTNYDTLVANMALGAVKGLISNGAVCIFSNISVAAAFGGSLPPLYKPVLVNNSGATTAASGNSANYTRIQRTGT